MPIYEYRCEDCRSTFELLRRMTDDDAELPCPECGNHRVVRQFSAFATAGATTGANASSSCGPGGFT